MSLLGRGGSLEDPAPSVRKVAGLNPSIAVARSEARFGVKL